MQSGTVALRGRAASDAPPPGRQVIPETLGGRKGQETHVLNPLRIIEPEGLNNVTPTEPYEEVVLTVDSGDTQ